MVETADMFDKEIGFKEIIFTSNSDSVIGEVNADMYAIHGLTDVIHGVTDNNVEETKEINDSLVDTRDISDPAEVIAKVVGSDVIEGFNVVETTYIVSQHISCLLEFHL